MSDEPRHERKQKAGRQPAHKHARDAFDWAQKPPKGRKDNVAIPDGRETCGREIESGLQGREAFPSVKSRPEKDFNNVQEDHDACYSHHNLGAMPQTEPARVSGKVSS